MVPRNSSTSLRDSNVTELRATKRGVVPLDGTPLPQQTLATNFERRATWTRIHFHTRPFALSWRKCRCAIF